MTTLINKGFISSLIISAFLIFGTFATAKINESEKDVKNKSITEKVVETKWFHFMGDASNPSELADQNKYTPVTVSPCESETQPYRCGILIDTDPTNSNLPDLSQPIQAETKRNTPEPVAP